MLKSILIAAALVVAGAGAQAAVMQAVFSGTINLGVDETGYFGAPNTDLAGTAYSLTYVYDTSIGDRYKSPGSDQLFDNGATPTVSASLTINGKTFSQTTDVVAQYLALDNNYFAAFSQDSFTTVDALGGILTQTTNIFAAGVYDFLSTYANGLETPFSASFPTSTAFDSYFQLFTKDVVADATITRVYGSLNVNNVAVTEVLTSAVPLPASLGLFVMALGGLGALRVRRRRVA